MSAITLTLVSLLAGAATGVGGILGVLFKPGERTLILGLGRGFDIFLSPRLFF